jgi:glutamate-1-semialdehyde aminotransferase
MLKAGFYLPPAQFEVGFVSVAHEVADVDRFVEAAGRYFKGVS